MLKKEKNQGFTLMELLVVIAIIGILSTVVLGQVNSARDKAESASVKAMMANMRVQAEICGQKYINNPPPATASCTTLMAAATVDNIFKDPTIVKAITKIKTQIIIPVGTAPVCSISGDYWAFYVPSLKGETGTARGWCVDNSGAAKVLSVATTSGATPVWPPATGSGNGKCP
jgi:prepilin-type N-terminal cleavage/methylation domain-containing protein